MLAVVTFKWSKPGYRSRFTALNVNTTLSMVRRNYRADFRFFCVTDDPTGLDAAVEHIPLWSDHAHVPNPTWPDGPSCYRRLKVFSDWFAGIVGPRFVCLDLDAVITGDLHALWDRPEDFLIWHTGFKHIPYCASMFMVRAGKLNRIWDDFDAAKSPQLAARAGWRGSDQAWITYCIGRQAAGWGAADGVYEYRRHIAKTARAVSNLIIPERLKTQAAVRRCALPYNARVVMFPGKPDPWDEEAVAESKWIAEHYR